MANPTLAGLCIIVAGTACAAGLDRQAVESYPSKPIRFIVPYAPGGPTDILARVLGRKLSERWGQQLIIDNRGGANGAIAAELAAKSVPDGYTLFLGNAGVLTTNPALYTKLPYDAEKDFAPVTLIAAAPLLLVVHPSLGIKTVPELVNLAHSRPGRLTFGSGGAGGVAHLAGELLNFMTGIKTVHVPYKGAAPAMTDLLGGQVDFTFTSTVAAIPNVKAGKLIGVAVTTRRRSLSLPNVPAIAESIPGYEVRPWYGVLVPAGTPRQIVDKLNQELAAVVRNQELVQRLAADGGEVVGESPEEFARTITREIAMWAKLAREAHLKLD